MNNWKALKIEDLLVEHQHSLLGIDCIEPRFGWKLKSNLENTFQTAYQIKIFEEGKMRADTGKVRSEQSIEIMIDGCCAFSMTEYEINNGFTISKDCPSREKAAWIGDIMALVPTMCFSRNAEAFLTKRLEVLRKELLDDEAAPMIVPYLKAYEIFAKGLNGSDTSCGWGDVILRTSYLVYQAYGDKKILEENYPVMSRWLQFIRERAENHHPEEWTDWDEAKRERSRYLWNTDDAFGDWLIPRLMLRNPDGGPIMDDIPANVESVGPAYYAYSAAIMAEIAEILGKDEDSWFYRELYEKIRLAFIDEYVHEDGTMDADYEGIYVIVLKNSLVSNTVRPLMVKHLCSLIEKNGSCLNTGFVGNWIYRKIRVPEDLQIITK